MLLLFHPELIDYPGFWVFALLSLLLGGILLFAVIMLVRKFFAGKKDR